MSFSDRRFNRRALIGASGDSPAFLPLFSPLLSDRHRFEACPMRKSTFRLKVQNRPPNSGSRGHEGGERILCSQAGAAVRNFEAIRQPRRRDRWRGRLSRSLSDASPSCVRPTPIISRDRTDIYVSLLQIRKFGLPPRGDTVEGIIRSPKENRTLLSRCLRSIRSISRTLKRSATRFLSDNLTAAYPNERLKLEIEDPTRKELSSRVIDLVRADREGHARWWSLRRAPARPC